MKTVKILNLGENPLKKGLYFMDCFDLQMGEKKCPN